ncbi:MAG: tRNA preQ1(34) S-adenosylmethionine ribosyltransferase-isomerase QueA [Oscillospiraceae bacterium]|nr:tRNA preQ1(34) S-adenosylmethionine ribosyltransferase-isomerase QueA [Oscillospiraceae bacterium]
MKTSDFYYDLPEELIAQDPLEDRSASRLLVLNKETGEIVHTIFKNIKNYLHKGDCVVLNDTKVIPARLIGEKEGSGGKIEFLLLKKISLDTWEIIVKPGKKAREGARVSFGGGLLTAEVEKVLPDGNRIVKFFYDGVFENVLDKLGQMPLPPYITHTLKDKNRYQTVYAKNNGSAAAPTAGLHFTKELLAEISKMGVSIAYLTLHVGLGTFRPVKVDDVENHVMHSEYYNIDEKNAEIINNAKKNGGRIISVGTTSTRVLETVADESGFVKAKSGETKIFIYPPYKYKIVDALITNFHLPESTLLMLVSALAGKDNIDRAYKQAVEMKYRFFSFGDAMFIE